MSQDSNSRYMHDHKHEPHAHDVPRRFSLRQLPLPAKLVITTFLIAVGIGYLSAMWQLHTQHTDRDGNPLPTRDNVIEIFSGLKKHDKDAPAPKCQMEELISGHHEEGWGKSNMAPAFFGKSGSDFTKDIGKRGKEIVHAERDGERNAMIAWMRTEVSARKQAYEDGEDGKFPLPPELVGMPITRDFVSEDGRILKIKSLIDTRCVKCHAEGDQKPPLENFACLQPLTTAPSTEIIDGKWVRSGKQMSRTSLTQSTHTHLLSFSMLFALTGLIVSFTSLPTLVRCILGPLVLIAEVVDVSCWWLAREEAPFGPMFAQVIIIAGGVGGVGLMLQIVLSLFDMYSWRGRFLLLLLVIVPLSAASVVVIVNRLLPELERQKKEALEKQANTGSRSKPPQMKATENKPLEK